MTGSVGGLHGIQGFVDLLFGDAFYLGADDGYGGWLRGEVSHYGEDGGCRVAALFAEDVGALFAHEDGRAWEASEDGDGVVGVTQEEATFL